ncbi:MAG: DUF2197 domain-containing protein [Actinomycetia bacterium]|jgi:uncharacterized protein YlaI|nr:DUF2197 domain-containing protein [Actinomycetes bacterium]
MTIRCTVCGKAFAVAKWNEAYERLRQHQTEPYVCDTCQARIRREAQDEAFPR